MKDLGKNKSLENQEPKCEQLESISIKIELTNGQLDEGSLSHIEQCAVCKEYYELWTFFKPLKDLPHKSLLSEWEKEIEVNKIAFSIREKKEKKRRLVWGGIISIVTALFFLVLALLYFSYFNYDRSPVEAGGVNKNTEVFQEDINPFYVPPINTKKNKDM